MLSLRLRQWYPSQTERMLEGHGFRVVGRSAAIGDSLAYLCQLR